MALSTQSAVLAKRRAFNYVQAFINPEQRAFVKALFEGLSQTRKNPDLQIVELSNSGTTDQVIADAPCKLYALFLKGGSAGGDYRSADHASSAATPTTTIPVAAAGTMSLLHPEGRAFTTGLTVDASQANAWTGFAIIGQP